MNVRDTDTRKYTMTKLYVHNEQAQTLAKNFRFRRLDSAHPVFKKEKQEKNIIYIRV